MEGIVLVLVVGLPWAFGGVDPVFELVQAVAISLLLVCWVCVACLNSRLTFARCSVTALLASLFVLGAIQLVPLPPGVLKILSPGSARLNAELLPSEPEHVAADVATPQPSVNRPISVYPHATRSHLFHWLEILILFAVVRHQLASTDSMRRLAIAAIVTGVAISLFGLYQTFRHGGHSVYGYRTTGQVFGPFINRNHAACFLNMCLGLGVGLLIYVGSDVSEYRRRMIQKPNAVPEQEEALGFSPFSVLHSPAQLWLLVALSIVLAGILCTLSRGGVAALVLGFVGAFALRLTWPPRFGRLEYMILPIVLVVGLLAWLGIKPLETRLADLWKGEVLVDVRWQLWVNMLALVPSFPVFGCGYGTLQYVEPLVRRQTDLLKMPHLLVDHAHNDYIEGLVEGGFLRFTLTAAIVLLIAVHGFRAMRRYSGRKPSAWAFGGMMGFLALAIHSAVDFSVQTPAVACLAAVLCAQLVALNRSDPTSPPSAAHPTAITLRFPIVGLLTLTVSALAVSGVLILHAWKADQVFRYRLNAFRALQRLKPPEPSMAIGFLEAATEIDPGDADLQLELGQIYLDRQPLHSKGWTTEAFIPGMQHMIAARNLCPLLPRPQMRLAAFASQLKSAQKPEDYWRRAELLAPSDPDLWFLHGVQLMKEGQNEKAWESWRRSLALSPNFLKEIVAAAYPKIGVEGLVEHILPDNPEILVITADLLPKDVAPESLSRIFRRAMDLLDQRQFDLSAQEFYLKARCAAQLGETDKALRAFRQAVDMNASQNEWRFHYARFLHRSGKLQDAMAELRLLIKALPDRADIREEYEIVRREIEIE